LDITNRQNETTRQALFQRSLRVKLHVSIYLSIQVSRDRKIATSCSRLAELLLSVTGACFLRFLGIVAADFVAGAAGLKGAAGFGTAGVGAAGFGAAGFGAAGFGAAGL
jgi:hypothetical protein